MSYSHQIHATFHPAAATQQAEPTASLFSLLDNTGQSTPEQVSDLLYTVRSKAM